MFMKQWVALISGCFLAWQRGHGQENEVIRPRCLDEDVAVPPQEIRKLRVDGVTRPFNMVIGDWSSARLVGEILMILTREVLGIDTTLSLAGTSVVMVELLAGCEDVNEGRASCHNDFHASVAQYGYPQPQSIRGDYDFSPEVWTSVAVDRIIELSDWLEDMGTPGYDGFEGLYVRKSTVENASSFADFLSFHMTYSANFDIASKYFDSYADVMANIAYPESEALTACSDDVVMKKADSAALYHHIRTDDKNGTMALEGNLTREYDCSGPGAAVWFSPACRSNFSKCIPVASTNGWALTSAGLSQKYVTSNMPVAVINFQLQAYIQAINKMDMLFYTWTPDAMFSSFHPAKVLFPAYDPAQWKQGFRSSAQPSAALRKMTQGGLGEYVPIDLLSLLQKFFISLEDVEEHLRLWPPQSNTTKESQIACSWVQANERMWQSWKLHICPEGFYAPSDGSKICVNCLEGFYCPPMTTETIMKQLFRCSPSVWCPNGSAVPQTCSAGRHFDSGTCTTCPEGTYSSTESSKCEECRPWLVFFSVNEDRSECNFRFVMIAILVFIVLVLVYIAFRIRRICNAVEDRPDLGETALGNWVMKWVGPSVHHRLTAADMKMSYSSAGNSGSKLGIGRRRTSVQLEVFKQLDYRIRGHHWIVNATPFIVTINHRPSSEICLSGETFLSVGTASGEMEISIEINERACTWLWWMPMLDNVATFCVTLDDWVQFRTKGSGTTRILYDDKVLRLPLPRENGTSIGEIKLVWRQSVLGRFGETLVVTWSPPHTLRGVPICDFVEFMDKAISSAHSWPHSARKKENEINMYDVSRHYIEKVAASFDASYAELYTGFGPADIFISHVWGEKVVNTRRYIVGLSEILNDPDRSLSETDGLEVSVASDKRKSTLSKFGKDLRIWFCAVCNNQARIAEELGSDIEHCPFALVLRSSFCRKVALFAPLKALERKWCNYEFSLAVSLGKEPLMVTKEGVVQHGHVAPKMLNDFSQKLSRFSCEQATCRDPKDEALIDEAVKGNGGYGALDVRLKKIFRMAIEDAQAWAQQAHNQLRSTSEEDFFDRTVEMTLVYL